MQGNSEDIADGDVMAGFQHLGPVDADLMLWTAPPGEAQAS